MYGNSKQTLEAAGRLQYLIRCVLEMEISYRICFQRLFLCCNTWSWKQKSAMKQELLNVKFAIARSEVLRVVTGLTSFAV
jgi:hypothetical protein